MVQRLTSQDIDAAWRALLVEQRTAVLLTLRQGRPFGSHAPYVLGTDWTTAYLHLSDLALHTRHLHDEPRLSLFICEPDAPHKNPTALRRMNLQGTAERLPPETDEHRDARARYLARFPQSAMLFGFVDFHLWALRMEEAHLVLGFGQAYVASAAAPGGWIHQQPERTSPL